MKSSVVKRSIVLSGHKTSVSLEDAFWRGLKDIAATRRMTLSDLVGSIDSERKHGNLSSAIRLSCWITTRRATVSLNALRYNERKLSARPMALVTVQLSIFFDRSRGAMCVYFGRTARQIDAVGY